MKIKYILCMLSFSSLMSMDKSLIDAVDSNDFKTVEALLADGEDPNKPDYSSGSTPLYVAVLSGQEKLVRLLLKYGANPNIHGSMKRAPFALAFLHGNMTMIGLLWKAGGIVDEAFICVLEKFVKMSILKLEVLFFLQRIAPSGLSGRVRALISQRILRESRIPYSHIANKMENFETAIQLMRGKQ